MKVAIIMGSDSDLPVMKEAALVLEHFGVGYDLTVVSAHRTAKRMYDYATTAHTKNISVIIAGAGGAAHLPGMVASLTHLPVIGVPVKSSNLIGEDSLLSIVQMPAGIPVGTLAIGKAGAINAALLAAAIVSNKHKHYRPALEKFRQEQTDTVLANSDPRGDKA